MIMGGRVHLDDWWEMVCFLFKSAESNQIDPTIHNDMLRYQLQLEL